jgi:hypothetical protein
MWLLAIRVEPTHFYCMGMAYLTARSAKYINKQEDYIEKWQKYVTCLSRNIPAVPHNSSHNKSASLLLALTPKQGN